MAGRGEKIENDLFFSFSISSDGQGFGVPCGTFFIGPPRESRSITHNTLH
jgi:hypothetical protein